jgi:hypothetical protein
MKPEDYFKDRVRLQMFQLKLHLFQVLIQFLTFISTLILLASKL